MSDQTNGVWGHSSTIGAEGYVLFSVDRADQNEVANTERRHAIQGFMSVSKIPNKRVLGSYKNVQEVSFVVNLEHLRAIYPFLKLAAQESILVLGVCDARDRRPAALHYLDKTDSEYLGLFQSVSRDEAMALHCWTYDPASGEYFACLAEPRSTVSKEYRIWVDEPSYLSALYANTTGPRWNGEAYIGVPNPAFEGPWYW